MILYFLALYFLLAFSISLCVWGLKKPENFLQYPFMVGVGLTGWLCPQARGTLLKYSEGGGEVIHGYLETIIMFILCIICMVLFYAMSQTNLRKKRTQKVTYTIKDTKKVKYLIYTYGILLGSGAYFALYGLTTLSGGLFAYFSAESGFYTLKMEGDFVIYLFFIRLVYPAIFLLLYHYFKYKWKSSLFFAGFFLLIPLSNILLLGRRSDVVLIGFTILLSMFFSIKKIPSRKIFIGGGIIVLLMVVSMTEYRKYSQLGNQNADKINEINPIENLNELLSGNTEDMTEFDVGRRIIYSVDDHKEFGLGVRFYNKVVKNFTPTAFISREFKNSLFFDAVDANRLTQKSLGWDRNYYGHVAPMGFTELFQEFWYFGAVFLGVVAFFIGRLWRKAVRGHFIAQVYYASMAWMFIISITNDFGSLFSYMVYYMIFLFPLFIMMYNSVIKKQQDL